MNSGNDLARAARLRCLQAAFQQTVDGVFAEMTKSTITVTRGSGDAKSFDGANAERDALEYAEGEAHRTHDTVYLTRVFKVVKPKREVTVEDVG